MEVLSKAVIFSPTGRAWAAATTEGLLIYGLDESLAFDPFELDEDITPESITKTLARREYARALVMALHLNEEPLIARCVEGVPLSSIPLVAQTLRGEMYLQRLLQLLAKRMERSPHLEFYLQWSLAVLNTHGQTLRDDPSSSATCLPTLRSLQKSIARHLQDLAKMYVAAALLRVLRAWTDDLLCPLLPLQLRRQPVHAQLPQEPQQDAADPIERARRQCARKIAGCFRTGLCGTTRV